MVRIPDPVPDEDLQKMKELKRAGLTYDQLVLEFGEKYKRGKIVGEITRAQKAGELFPPSGNAPPQPPVAAPGGVILPPANTPSQPQLVPAPGWTIINRPQPPKLVYHNTTEPTIIFTQAPQVPEKPFDLVEYTTKKAIDLMLERAKTPPSTSPPPMAQPSPAHTQDQIGILQRKFDQLEDTRRQKAEEERRRQEERKADEKIREDERTRKDAEDRKRLAELGEEVRKFRDELDQSIQADKKENVNIFQKCTIDNTQRGLEFTRATHEDTMKQQELQDAHDAKRFAAATDDIRWFRETGKMVHDMTYPQRKMPQTFVEQYPGVGTYGFIRNEVHEEIQQRIESDRKKRNQEIIVGAIGAILILGKEIIKNCNRRT